MTIRLGAAIGLLAATFALADTDALASTTDAEHTRRAADLAADYLVRVQTEKGLFPYDISFRTGRPTGKSHIVRQAGTAFSLAEYLWLDRSPRIARAVRAALEGLQAKSVIHRKRGRWLVSADGSFGGTLSGATAFALLTETLYFRATGDGRFEAARRAWLAGLLGLRLKGRGFRRSAASKKESPYFNGEAWLALAHHFDTFGDPEVGAVLEQLDGYLLRTYGRTPHIGFFHWGVMAAAVRHRQARDARFLTFIEGQARHYLLGLRPKVKPKANTCYALEGLLTASALLTTEKRGSDILPALARRIEADVAKNFTFQLVEEGDLTVRPPKKPIDVARHRGLFFARSNRRYARIDHTQHCLSAFVRLARMQAEPHTR